MKKLLKALAIIIRQLNIIILLLNENTKPFESSIDGLETDAFDLVEDLVGESAEES